MGLNFDFSIMQHFFGLLAPPGKTFRLGINPFHYKAQRRAITARYRRQGVTTGEGGRRNDGIFPIPRFAMERWMDGKPAIKKEPMNNGQASN